MIYLEIPSLLKAFQAGFHHRKNQIFKFLAVGWRQCKWYFLSPEDAHLVCLMVWELLCSENLIHWIPFKDVFLNAELDTDVLAWK